MDTHLTETQLAYIAGLIDGEGSLESQRQIQRGGVTPLFQLRLAFVMSTAEPLATVAAWLGLTPKMYPSTDERRQDRYRLSVPKLLACELLEQCLPYLILKRDQAELVLEIERTRKFHSPSRRHFGHKHAQPMPPEGVAALEALHVRLRSLKSNKRPMHLRG